MAISGNHHRFLVHLNLQTWESFAGKNLADDVRHAMNLGLDLVPVWENISTTADPGDGPDPRCGCDFQEILRMTPKVTIVTVAYPRV